MALVMEWRGESMYVMLFDVFFFLSVLNLSTLLIAPRNLHLSLNSSKMIEF